MLKYKIPQIVTLTHFFVFPPCSHEFEIKKTAKSGSLSTVSISMIYFVAGPGIEPGTS